MTGWELLWRQRINDSLGGFIIGQLDRLPRGRRRGLYRGRHPSRSRETGYKTEWKAYMSIFLRKQMTSQRRRKKKSISPEKSSEHTDSEETDKISSPGSDAADSSRNVAGRLPFPGNSCDKFEMNMRTAFFRAVLFISPLFCQISAVHAFPRHTFCLFCIS